MKVRDWAFELLSGNSMVKKCLRCNGDNDDYAVFCSSCGTRLSGMRPSILRDRPVTTEVATSVREPLPSRTRDIAVLVVFLIGSAGVFHVATTFLGIDRNYAFTGGVTFFVTLTAAFLWRTRGK
jgi:hypothetical protein